MRVARVLFARVPEPGKVKTRLAADLDDKAALAFYQWLLRVQSRAMQQRTVPGAAVKDFVYFAPRMPRLFARHRFSPHLAGRSLTFRAQTDGDLGERLAAAASDVLATHDMAFIWGADIPILPENAVEQAAALYPQSLISLARDGGYGCISVSREYFNRSIFHGIRWSTHHTGRDQLRALLNAGVPTVVAGGKLADFDRVRDLPRIIRSLEEQKRADDLADLAATARQLRSG